MKVTRIKALCKNEKHCVIYQYGKRRMIGTLNAAYLAEKLQIEKDSISTLFDWPGVKDELRIEEMQLEETRMHPVTDWTRKLPQMLTGMPIAYIDETLIPLSCEGGIYFIREAYANAAEKTEGYTGYYLGSNVLGEPLIIMSDGMITTAIIKPLPQRTAQSVRAYMETMTRMEPRGWTNENKTVEDQQLPGQISMDEMEEDLNDDRE